MLVSTVDIRTSKNFAPTTAPLETREVSRVSRVPRSRSPTNTSTAGAITASKMLMKTVRGRGQLLCGLALALVGVVSGVMAEVPKSIEVRPAAVELVGRRALARLSVLGRQDGGRVTDLSRVATYTVENPKVVAVTAQGRLTPVADGRSRVTVAFGG